jgi:nicotinate-nucleotide pyrophosphorylase (carboxylating)
MGECYLRRSRRVIGMAFLFLTLIQVRGYAETGVDFISVGGLTHSVRALDISLELTHSAI